MNDNTRIPQHELLINGKWVPPESGQYSTILNPATEEVIAHVAAGSEKDVDTAAKAARAALKVWNGISAAERGRILNRLADLLEQHQEELIALESTNAGKPIASVRRQDMPAAIDTLRYYAGWTDKIIGQVIPARTDALTYTVREPVGVVGAIVPWNFPLMIGIWKIAPALACGCTLIVKPAELTPMTAIRIGELALEAGIPPGVLNIVTGKGSVVGDAMVAHPQIDKITFTGSPKVGRGIMQGAAVNFKKITLELGGKSANIIFDDADLDSAVRGSASGIFFNAGQVCSAGSRILVHKKIHNEVVGSADRTRKTYPHRRHGIRRYHHGTAGFPQPDEYRHGLHRHRQKGRCLRRIRWPACRRQGLLCLTDHLHRRQARNAYFTRRNLRRRSPASFRSKTKKTPSGSPTGRHSVWQPVSGAPTSPAFTKSLTS